MERIEARQKPRRVEARYIALVPEEEKQKAKELTIHAIKKMEIELTPEEIEDAQEIISMYRKYKRLVEKYDEYYFLRTPDYTEVKVSPTNNISRSVENEVCYRESILEKARMAAPFKYAVDEGIRLASLRIIPRSTVELRETLRAYFLGEGHIILGKQVYERYVPAVYRYVKDLINSIERTYS